MSVAPPTASHSKIEFVAKCADILSKSVGIAALLLGGLWTYWQFTVTNTRSETLSLSLSPRIVALETASPMVITDVFLKNIGRSSIRAGGRKGGESPGEGCELTVIEYTTPLQFAEGETPIVDWWEGGRPQTTIIEKYNILGGYTSFKHGRYVLDPGQEFHESAVFPAKPGKLYGVRARFFSDLGWTDADFQYVYIPAE